MSSIDDLLYAPLGNDEPEISEVLKKHIRLADLVNLSTKVDWNGGTATLRDIKDQINLNAGHIIWFNNVRYVVTRGGSFDEIEVSVDP